MPCREGCGRCCDPVTVNAARRRAELAAGPTALLMAWPQDPELYDWLADLLPLGRNAVGDDIFLCPRFDPVEKVCADYDRRPNVCRDFPFYGGLVELWDIPECGYWAESPVSVRGLGLGVQ